MGARGEVLAGHVKWGYVECDSVAVVIQEKTIFLLTVDSVNQGTEGALSALGLVLTGIALKDKHNLHCEIVFQCSYSLLLKIWAAWTRA